LKLKKGLRCIPLFPFVSFGEISGIIRVFVIREMSNTLTSDEGDRDDFSGAY
jgi:hypothetical protein